MRNVLILLAVLFLFAASPAMAQDNPQHPKAQMLARLLGAWLDSVGDTLSGDDNTVAPTTVDGSNNTVFNIDELVINIDVGDMAVNEQYGGADEVANRLVDLLMQGMEKREQVRGERSGVAMIPPPYCGGFFGSNTTQPVDSNSQWASQYRQESRAARHQDREMGDKAEEHRDRPRGRGYTGERGEPTPPAAGVLEHRPQPEVLEMLMQIPPDVEPEFIEFMMEVGRLAREYPEFREHLEKLVEKAHEREAEAGH